jgi:phasin family protein
MATKQTANVFDFDVSKFDVSKYLGDFKVPGVDVETLVASQRKNIEALTQANKLAFEGFQALFKRQVEIARQSIEESATVARQLVEAGTPQEKAVRQTELTKDAFEQALANSRELSEIVAKSNGEAFDLLNKRFFQVLDELKDNISKTAK